MFDHPSITVGLLATGMATVGLKVFGIELRAGQLHLFRIRDNDEITDVTVWSVLGLVLAHQDDRQLDGEAAEHLVRGVDDVPSPVHDTGFGVIGLTIHVSATEQEPAKSIFAV